MKLTDQRSLESDSSVVGFPRRLGKRAVTGVTHSGSVWESVGVCSASWLTETGFTVSENTVASQLVL